MANSFLAVGVDGEGRCDDAAAAAADDKGSCVALRCRSSSATREQRMAFCWRLSVFSREEAPAWLRAAAVTRTMCARVARGAVCAVSVVSVVDGDGPVARVVVLAEGGGEDRLMVSARGVREGLAG